MEQNGNVKIYSEEKHQILRYFMLMVSYCTYLRYGFSRLIFMYETWARQAWCSDDASMLSYYILESYACIIDGTNNYMYINRFLHTFLGKTGWSSTSDRNFMSFREWSAAKRAKRHNNFYHERKITRAFPTTHVSTYFFRKPTTFTIANS